MWAYCDSSVLVKRYVRESGRRKLLGLLRERSCVSSALTPVEIRSAFRRRVHEGSLDVTRLPTLLHRLAADRSRWTLVTVGPGSATLPTIRGVTSLGTKLSTVLSVELPAASTLRTIT